MPSCDQRVGGGVRMQQAARGCDCWNVLSCSSEAMHGLAARLCAVTLDTLLLHARDLTCTSDRSVSDLSSLLSCISMCMCMGSKASLLPRPHRAFCVSMLCAGMQEGKAQGATAAKLAQQLDKRIFVGWPFLREAIIHAVADKSIKVLPQPPSLSGMRRV